MKKLILIFTTTCTLLSCQAQNTESFSSILKFPSGTQFKSITNTNNETTKIEFTLPEGSKYFSISSANLSTVGTTGSLTCTCSGSGGCKPFVAPKGNAGCLIDGCSTCTGKTKASAAPNGDEVMFFIQNGVGKKEIGLSAFLTLRPVLEIDEWLNSEFITNEVAQSEEFKNEVDNLLAYFNNSRFDQTIKITIPLLYKGQKLLIDAPFDSVEEGMLYSSMLSERGTCSGSCKSGNCKSVSVFGTGVTYCDGCQSGCTITTK